MKHTLEKIAILSLSLMLVSTFAVSPALPAMISHFAQQGYQASQVEFLITITSLAIMTSLLMGPFLGRFLSERQLISSGLVLVALGGSLPLVTQTYALIFVGRIVLGLGLGLINEKAISIVSTHFTGQERVQMLGWRGSAEVLGSASLTALVGALLPLGWSSSFAIYLTALLILALYLLFVPDAPQEAGAAGANEQSALSRAQWQRAIFLAIVAGVIINANTVLTLKIPGLVEDAGLGTASQASLVLSLMLLMGIVAGLVFANLLKRLNQYLLPLAVLVFSLGLFLTVTSPNLVLMTLAAVLVGFFYSIVLTIVFKSASDNVPKHQLNQMMTIVLVGCNLGGASSSLIPVLINQVFPGTIGLFGVYTALGLALGLALLVKNLKK